jgi:hypothetical protein
MTLQVPGFYQVAGSLKIGYPPFHKNWFQNLIFPMNNCYFGWLTQFSDTAKNNFPNDPHYIPMVPALPWRCFYRQETHVMIPGTTSQSQSEAHIPRAGQRAHGTPQQRPLFLLHLSRSGGNNSSACFGDPLVNIQKTMEHHHFQWVNPL